MNDAFDTALAEFHRLRAAELAAPGWGSIEEEQAHREEMEDDLTATGEAFDLMIAVPVMDGPRAAAKLRAVADFYMIGACGIDGRVLDQVLAEVDAALVKAEGPPPPVCPALAAEFEAAEARAKAPWPDDANDDAEIEARNEALYGIVERIHALPNTPENLAARARAVCSAVDYTGTVAEVRLSELGAHASCTAGEIILQILACLLGQVPA